MSAMWCCEGFKNAFDQRHGRSIYVFAEPPTPQLSVPTTFWIGCRAIAKEHLAGHSLQCEVPVTLATWIAIHRCPWCGVKLDRFYRRSYRQICDPSISLERAA